MASDLALTSEQQALYAKHESWAVRMAQTMRGRLPGSFDVDDLCQAARVGLVKAAGRYDPHRNDNFRAWAATYVGGEIRMLLRRRNWTEASHGELPAVLVDDRVDREAAWLQQTANTIAWHQREAERAAADVLLHKIAIGRALTEAKERLEHGQWLRWLADNFKWSPRHAQNHMKLAQHASRVNALVGMDASMRGALAALRGTQQGPLCYLLVGILAEQPAEGATPEELMAHVSGWKIQHRRQSPRVNAGSGKSTKDRRRPARSR